MQPFIDILDSGKLPNPISDAKLIFGQRALDELIYLSLGESWLSPAAGLVEALGQIPDYAHGYTLSPYGLPILRRTLKKYIEQTHQLPASDSYNVAVSQAGTRSAMSDFANLLRNQSNKPYTVLLPEPGWDYHGIFEPLGFDIEYYQITQEHNWQPNPDDIIAKIKPNSLLVLNPQHNPTGTEWSEDVVSQLITLAIDNNASILIDDAYYALHQPGSEPTNALRILIEKVRNTTKSRWLAVRTMGKQFCCNGWGIGAITASPDTLVDLAQIACQHSYGSAIPLQAAMDVWLKNPDSEHYISSIRQHYSDARNKVAQLIVDTLGFPDEAVQAGTCTSYMRFKIPPRFLHKHDDDAYRRLCLTAGVLPGHGTMTANKNKRNNAYVRIHLGHPIPVLELAINRLKEAGLGW